jgi:hypothetical protein
VDVEIRAFEAAMANTLVTQSQLDEFARMKQVDGNLTTYSTNQQYLMRQQQKRAFWENLELITGILVSVVTYFVGHYLALRRSNKLAYDWWHGKKMASCVPDASGNYGYQRGPRPQGEHFYSMDCVVVSDNYKGMASVMRFLHLGCNKGTLNDTQTQFLLLVLQVLFRNMEAIHWAGNPEQLNFSEAHNFVLSWSAWNSDQNVWAWMLTEDMFSQSVAILQAQKQWVGSYMFSLYFGGLCNVAWIQANDKDSPTDMVKKLLGVRPVYYRSCYDNRLAQAISVGTTAGMATFAGIAAFKKYAQVVHGAKNVTWEGHGTRLAAAWATKNTKLGAAVSKSVTEAKDFVGAQKIAAGAKISEIGEAAAARAATLAPKTVAAARSIKEASMVARGASRARLGAMSSSAFGDGVSRLGVAGAEVTAEMVGEVAVESGVAVGAGGLGMAASLVGGDAACSVFLFAAPLCGLIVTSIILSVASAVVVGCAAGAISAANYKCKGGEYYVLVQNDDGTSTRFPWNGDPSTLPGPLARAKKDDASAHQDERHGGSCCVM